jgi:hypothetical protein
MDVRFWPKANSVCDPSGRPRLISRLALPSKLRARL